MEMTTISGNPTYYPKLKELSEGEIIFERAKYVSNNISKFGQTNYVFEADGNIFPMKNGGLTNRIGLSAGQVASAMESEPFGGNYKIVYTGEHTIKGGTWDGKLAHTFIINRYVGTDTTSETKKTTTPTTKPTTQQSLPLEDGLESLL